MWKTKPEETHKRSEKLQNEKEGLHNWRNRKARFNNCLYKMEVGVLQGLKLLQWLRSAYTHLPATE